MSHRTESLALCTLAHLLNNLSLFSFLLLQIRRHFVQIGNLNYFISFQKEK